MVAVAAARFLINGWVAPLYLEPRFHFTYLGFGWVHPWPGAGMYLHFSAIVVLGMAVAFGFRYRRAAMLLFIAFTYVELLDRTWYLNHYYWVSVVCLALVFLPLHRGTRTVPAWVVWSLRGLVGMVYVFAAIAKLNPDWLLRGMPLALWLPQDADLPIIGPLVASPSVPLIASWATVAFELAVVPLLLIGRTRAVTYAVAVVFHVGTWIVLPEIGMFPMIMMASALVFFAPSWPRDVAARLRLTFRARAEVTRRPGFVDRIAPAAVAVMAFSMVVLPLRHLAYAGDVRWTDEGYRLSWRVMLTEKVGLARFEVVDTAGTRHAVNVDDYLTAPQKRAMAFQPDMILDVAHLIRDDYRSRGMGDVAVYADVMVSMNGRPARRLVDPNVDLAAVAADLGPKAWVLRS